jgi:hypothetical protein
MVNEHPVPPFLEWWQAATLHWLLIVGGLALLLTLGGLLVVTLERGPGAAFSKLAGLLLSGAKDLLLLSPRRVWALTWLAVKESIRRRVVVAFAVFVVVLLFAGWFLDPSSHHPGRLYMDVVLSATSYLVLLLALFLSALSLPNDIRNRTLHTVVTKPVRPSEIVLGRMIGFTIVGTVLLGVMCLLSYGFVVRGLSHSHTIDAADVTRLEKAAAIMHEGKLDAQTVRDKKDGDSVIYSRPKLDLQTTRDQGHRHRFQVDPNLATRSRTIHLDEEAGHTHDLSYTIRRSTDASGKAVAKLDYTLGPPRGALVARVPIYGKLMFRDRSGIDAERGINTGDEWTYRSFIQGGTQAAAIWTFDLDPRQFPREVPVEMNIGVFRTYKGNIEKGVLGSLAVRNPKNGLTVEVQIFQSTEFIVKKIVVPRRIVNYSGKRIMQRTAATPHGMVVSPPADQYDPALLKKTEFDLFRDLSDNGKFEVWLQCVEPAQYFGAAQPDLYIRAGDASFELNFVKAYLGIWMQMVLMIAFGVMFSTFLSGPVALTATLGALVGGLFNDFMTQLAHHQVVGGGPTEALVRILKQQNVVTELDPGLGTTVVKVLLDKPAELFLRLMSSILPSFGDFGYAGFVAYGYNVDLNMLAVHLVTTFSFLVPLFIAGYFFLKTREIAR